jgi:predicted anti-sigma-YlaC factor YlaD
MMNCHAYQSLLQQRLDGTPIESPEAMEHLRACAECQTLEKASRRLEASLRRLTSPVPPPDLAQRIAKRVLMDRRRVQRRARRRLAATFALAACLLVALALRLDWPISREAFDTGRTARNVTKVPPIPQKQSSPPTLRESVAEASGAVASLTSQTADEAVESTRWLVPRVSASQLPEVKLSSIKPPTAHLSEASEGVSAGLEPVTSSARRAVDLFLRELPPMDGGQKGY